MLGGDYRREALDRLCAYLKGDKLRGAASLFEEGQ